jgi:hypothetical protein
MGESSRRLTAEKDRRDGRIRNVAFFEQQRMPRKLCLPFSFTQFFVRFGCYIFNANVFFLISDVI